AGRQLAAGVVRQRWRPLSQRRGVAGIGVFGDGHRLSALALAVPGAARVAGLAIVSARPARPVVARSNIRIVRIRIMTQVYDQPPRHMGLPLPHGKVAMWLFLVTEIMFFTALIGTYIVLRHGTPSNSPFKWPTPHQVHLIEWIGALNTFVLICSSFTVVL